VSLRGPSRYDLSLPLRAGRTTPSLPLPLRMRKGRYVVHFLLRDANGAAVLAPATVVL
jgi:hypothetical protein